MFANLVGVSILLKQMLEQDLLTHEEADAVMRKIVIDNGFSEGNYTLGVQMVEATSRVMAQRYGYDEAGIYIYEVVQGSDAQKAGLKAGDRLITINGKEIDSFETARGIIKSMKKGKTLSIVVDRNDKEITFDIEI